MNQFAVSLWGDEGWAITLAVKPIFDIVRIVAKDTSPPLFYLLLHAWISIWGTSETAIRSLTFIFFLGTVVTVFFIGKHLWDKKTGLLAAILTFTNPFLFSYAFEGRMYSLLALTSTLSIYFFIRKKTVPFILSTAAALYTHHFSIFIIFFEIFWRLLSCWRKPIKKILFSFTDFFVVAILYIPWIYPLYYQTSLVKSGFWLGKPKPGDLLEVMVKFLVGPGKETFRIIALGLIVVAAALRKQVKQKEGSFFLIGWFFTPLILTFFVSQIFQPIFYDRYLLLTIPAASLFLASQRRKMTTIFIGIAIVLLAFYDLNYFLHPTKRPFSQMAAFIKQQASNLPLINFNGSAHHLWESKYYGLNAPIYSPQPLPFYAGTALMEKGDVIASLPDQKIIGVITSSQVEEVKIPNYHILDSKHFGQLSFVWIEQNHN